MLLLSLLFTGYLVNIAAVWVGLRWAHYLSVFFYGFESLIVNEMSGISLIFSVSPVAYMDGTQVAIWMCCKAKAATPCPRSAA